MENLTWSMLKKQKAKKEIRASLMAWAGLVATGLIMFPILWGIIAISSGIDL